MPRDKRRTGERAQTKPPWSAPTHREIRRVAELVSKAGRGDSLLSTYSTPVVRLRGPLVDERIETTGLPVVIPYAKLQVNDERARGSSIVTRSSTAYSPRLPQELHDIPVPLLPRIIHGQLPERIAWTRIGTFRE